MQKSHQYGKEKKLSFVKRIKRKIIRWLRLTNDPVIKVYNGYGNSDKLVVFGHAFKTESTTPKKIPKECIYE